MRVTRPLWSSAIELIVFYVILVLIATVAVILRFVCIRIRNRAIKIHDWLCVLSLTFLWGYAIDTLIGTIKGGMGLHVKDLTPPEVIIAFKTLYACEYFWLISITSFRLSTLLLYLEIFAVPLVRRPAFFCGALVLTFFIGTIIAILTSCRPTAYNLNGTIRPTVCEGLKTEELVGVTFNLVLDILIVLVPAPMVWKLQIAVQKKVAVTLIFGLGLSICGVNLARVINTAECNLDDFTYCSLSVAILSVAEMACGILVACVPTLGPLLSSNRSDSRRRSRNYDNEDPSASLKCVGRKNKPTVEPDTDNNELELEDSHSHAVSPRAFS